ncbi:MAG: ester cyclase [Pacificimonas sp.]
MTGRPIAILLDLIEHLGAAQPDEVAGALSSALAKDCESHFYFPFAPAHGAEGAAREFWTPLRNAFPDYEIRPAMVLEGEYEDRQHLSMLGFLSANFRRSFVGIRATKKLTHLRFAINLVFQADRAIACFVMFDLLELMRGAGLYPFRRMPGSAEQWLFPPFVEPDKMRHDGSRSLDVIREMQAGLPDGPAVVDRASAAAHHSRHWSPTMNWFGPAGIGSSRGMEGFRDAHGALFLRAFPDRQGIARAGGDALARPGHFCEIGDGAYAMTAGWPNMEATHSGAQWLGLPPTGRRVEMRVADWYRLNREGKIADNWVLIDIPRILDQMGLDIIAELPFATDPELPRLP